MVTRVECFPVVLLIMASDLLECLRRNHFFSVRSPLFLMFSNHSDELLMLLNGPFRFIPVRRSDSRKVLEFLDDLCVLRVVAAVNEHVSP